MLTTALLLMLASTDVQPAFLSDGVHRSIRLVVDEAAPPPPDLPSYAGWSRRQLEQETERLKETRPGIGLPIGLMSGGGGALVLSLYVLMLSVAGSGGINSSSVPFLALCGVVGTAGAAMLIVGGILLARVLPERRVYGRQLDEIDRILKENEQVPSDERRYLPPEPPIIGPPPEGPPPPALPPFTPQSSVQIPLIFARF